MIFIGYLSVSFLFVFLCSFKSSLRSAFSVVYACLCSVIFFSIYTNGIDWVNYYYVFDEFKTSFSLQYDLIFSSYLYLTSYLIGSFKWSILIFYAISFYVLYKFASKSTLPINIPALILSLVMLGGVSLVIDQIRQFAAICVCFLSMNCVFEKKLKTFLLTVLIASLLHYSALIALIFWYAYHSSKKTIIISGVCISVSMVFIGGAIFSDLSIFHSVPLVGSELARKAVLNGGGVAGDGFGFGVIADILIIICFMTRFDKDHLSGLWNILFLFSCIHIGVYFLPAFARFYYYSFVPLSILLAHIANNSRQKVRSFDIPIIIGAVSIIALIVTYKTFTDIRRPNFLNYSIEWVTGSDRSIDLLRSIRCNELNVLTDDFCSK